MSFLPHVDRSLLRFPPLKSRPFSLEKLDRCLMDPLQDLLARPRKEVRGSLVHVGYELVRGPHDETLLEPLTALGLAACAMAIESLHTGSLIIDDIEDESQWRRGGPTLHLKYGTPTALNAGNWLYFLAFEKIRGSGLSAELRVRLYELMEEILLEAHTGQALDVGTDISAIPPDKIPEICLTSLELKSGALMALALEMGAIVGQASSEQHEVLRSCGVEFGVSLQMFDDLGNVRTDRPTGKHLEDLQLRRPSFVWWCLAENFPLELSSFVEAVGQLPDTTLLKTFLERVPLIETGFSRALKYQQQALRNLEVGLNPAPLVYKKLVNIADKVAHAYS